MNNQAAWINSKGQAIEIGPAEVPTPGQEELVIEVSSLLTLCVLAQVPKQVALRIMQSHCILETGSLRRE